MKKKLFPFSKPLLAFIILLIILSTTLSCTTTPSPTTTTPPVTSATTTAVVSPTSTATAAVTPTTTPTISGVVPTAQSPTGTATVTPTATATPTASAAALGSVEVLGVWGSTELASFQAMVAPWEQQTGGKMQFTGTRDLTAVLTTRLQAGNPPDIAILPNPGLMKQLVSQGYLKPLNNLVDMTAITQEYPKAWIDLGTVNGNLYSLFIRAANKSMIWYDPKTFTANGWNIPTTYADLINLSNTIVSANKVPAAPWSVGVENAQASGWPATDWMAQYFLSKYGGDLYDQWVNHQIPWTDPRIKDAWDSFGTIANTPGYVPGGATAVLATNFQSASYLPFMTPSKAAMYYEGDFTQGFITAQFPSLVAGVDYDYFPFPAVGPSASVSPSGVASPAATTAASSSAVASPTITPGAVTGGADLVAVFKDTPTVRSFVSYLATAKAQDIWVKRGGFISVNTQVNLSDYPDVIARKSVEQLLNASVFRFGAGDSMPSAMQTAWWAGVLQYLQNPGQLDAILTSLENTAKTAYAASPTPSLSPSASPPASAVSPSSAVSPTP